MSENRFTSALAISDGACNPSGIAHAIVEACRECRASGNHVKGDPAIWLMVHQLATLYGMEPMDGESMDLWRECRIACHQGQRVAALAAGDVA